MRCRSAPLKKSQAETTTAKNLEDKFDRGEAVIDYFDFGKAHAINPKSKGHFAKTKFAYPAKHNSRRAIVRAKSVRYRKKK
jgi:hypothetical protein